MLIVFHANTDRGPEQVEVVDRDEVKKQGEQFANLGRKVVAVECVAFIPVKDADKKPDAATTD